MASVWYIGTAHERLISASEWTRVGSPGSALKWDKSNGWSISQSLMTAGQIAFLNELTEFVVTEADGPRPDAAITSSPNSAVTTSFVLETVSSTVDDFAKAVFSERANTTHLLNKLKSNLEDVSILVIGDSTGNEAAEWVRLTATTLASRFPTHTVVYHLWDITGGAAYDTGAGGSATTVQTGTGSRTLHVWNCSTSGQTAMYVLASRWAASVVAPTPDMVFINLGHNEGTTAGGVTPVTWRTRMLMLTESIALQHPLTSVCLILQNPRGDASTDQQARARVYREIAEMRGYGLIDVQAAFLAVSDYASSLVQGDFIHPTAPGSSLWAAEVAKALAWSKDARPRAQTPSVLSTLGKSLLVNGGFTAFASAVPDNWTATAATTAKDTRAGWFESATGWGVRIQASSAAQSFISQDVAAGLLPALQGKWVTLAVRLKVPSGQTATAGRVQLADSTGATHSSTGATDLRDGWFWAIASLKVAAAATFVRARVYADTAATATADITVDSVHLVLGVLPRVTA